MLFRRVSLYVLSATPFSPELSRKRMSCRLVQNLAATIAAITHKQFRSIPSAGLWESGEKFLFVRLPENDHKVIFCPIHRRPQSVCHSTIKSNFDTVKAHAGESRRTQRTRRDMLGIRRFEIMRVRAELLEAYGTTTLHTPSGT